MTYKSYSRDHIFFFVDRLQCNQNHHLRSISPTYFYDNHSKRLEFFIVIDLYKNYLAYRYSRFKNCLVKLRLCGTGLLHSRRRICSPVSVVTGNADQGCHSLQPPSETSKTLVTRSKLYKIHFVLNKIVYYLNLNKNNTVLGALT